MKAEERTGLIMELPPYHRPKWGSLLRYVFGRTKDVLIRALKVILLISLIFWLLSYTADGNVEHSVIYRIGTFIEPLTRVFGLSWQTFLAFVSSAVSKEAALGVLSSPVRRNRHRICFYCGNRGAGGQSGRNLNCQHRPGGGAGLHLCSNL